MRDERGTAMLEFSISIPLVVLMTLCLVDVSRMLNEYFTVNRVTYEALRYAATVPALEEGTYTKSGAEIPANRHALIYGRVQPVLAESDISQAQVKLVSSYTKVNRAVAVTVEVPFTALFPPLRFVQKLSVTASGPYLFPPDTPLPEIS